MRRAISAIGAAMALSAGLAMAGQPDTESIVGFQRAADAYAFLHRQVQRRLTDDPGQASMAAAMRKARPEARDGEFFSPLVANAFRTRIARALRTPACRLPDPIDDFRVARPNDDVERSASLPSCLKAVLPPLPEELDYRISGVTVLLVDTHANLVVDVLHGALPPR